MGDRISISFTNGKEESVALFSHWGGLGFLDDVIKYAQELRRERTGQRYPLDRLEPSTVMLDFIHTYLSSHSGRIMNDYHLGKHSGDGDNSDNGHFRIPLDAPITAPWEAR